MEHELIAEWFQYADMDLESAEYLQGKRPQPLEIMCFLCQQSAEKNLKGYLIFKTDTEQSKTHDLMFLINKCADFDKRFSSLEKACGALNRYGVQPRYPNELGITINDALKALEYARQVRDFDLIAAVRKDVEQK